MKTLIELYDERPLENVLSTEVFRPERTVFICPPEVAADQQLQNKLREYFRHRGIRHECIFFGVSLLDAQAVERKLREVVDRYPDCALDIAGGTDATLFASGLLCGQREIPVFTYSRKRNTFFNIRGADFANDLPCQVKLSVEDCFLMAGGSMRMGRVDNAVLSRYLSIIEPMFGLYLRHRREWPRIVTYIQRVSQQEDGLCAQGSYTVKGEHGGRVSAPEAALNDMAKIDLIHDLRIDPEQGVSFTFADAQIRAWLRDVGSALELYVRAYQRRGGLAGGEAGQGQRDQRIGRDGHRWRQSRVHQLQNLRRQDRGLERIGHPAGSLRRSDGPRRHRHGGTGTQPHAAPSHGAGHRRYRSGRSEQKRNHVKTAEGAAEIAAPLLLKKHLQNQ